MKAKKIISALLSIGLLATCVASASATTPAAEAKSYNDYQNMLAQTKAENNYGLAKTVNEGKILQAWNWSYENVIEKLEMVAEQGFTTIQVSPPNEIKMPTKGVHVCEPANANGEAPNGWWMFYQPAGFQLNESEDNALGTKAQFVEMCEKAHKMGLKIIVDAVINHMGTDDDHTGDPYNNTSTDPMTHVNPRAQEFEPELIAAKAFHSPWVDCIYKENYWDGYSDFDIEESITQHCTSGLPDLDTSTQLVQDVIYDYLEELVIAGADGFRIDAAKHIETSEDKYFASDFWEDTLLKIRKNYPDCEAYAYGEILNKCGDGRPFSRYTKMMDVTDSASFWGIKDAVCNNGSNGNSIPSYPSYEDSNQYGEGYVKFTKENVIQWNESHDTYIDGGTSFFTVQQRNKIWALTAARQTITGVYFARPDDRVGSNRAAIEKICYDILLGEARVTSWANDSVKAVNQFSNYYGDAEESLSVQKKVTVIERNGTGAVLVNLNGTNKDVDLYVNTLSDGTYTDSITGGTFEVTDGYIKGSIGSTGIAVLYYSEDTEPKPLPGIIYPVEKKEGYNAFVFSNNYNWSDVYCYAWKDSTKTPISSWPGDTMRFARTNEHGESQYLVYVPVEYDRIIFNDGGNNKTKDIVIEGSTGYYLSGFGSPYTAKTWEFEWADQGDDGNKEEKPQVSVSLKLKKTKISAGTTTKAVATVKNANGAKVKYTSSNPKVAKIDQKGVITALNKGTVKITATVSGKKATKSLTVSTAPTLKLGKKKLSNNATVSLKKGTKKTITIVGKVSNIRNSVKMKSTKIAKVTSKVTQSKVIIKGNKKGNTTLTIKINGVKTYKVKVKVK